MFDSTEDWFKIWRKTDLCFPKWHEDQARNQKSLGRVLGIRALRKTIICNTKKKGPAGKYFQCFLLRTLKNCTLNEKFNPLTTAIRTFFPKLGHFFPFSEKGQGRPSLLPPPSYTCLRTFANSHRLKNSQFILESKIVELNQKKNPNNQILYYLESKSTTQLTKLFTHVFRNSRSKGTRKFPRKPSSYVVFFNI